MKVSVCMITYGHEQYIKEAIESVLMQSTDFGYELIIADDCSPDVTENVVRSLIESHKNGHRIRYTKHKENLGMMPNFVYALKQCKGKYIALCEGDDYWTDPLKLQKQVDFLENNSEYVLSFHDTQILNIKNELNNYPKNRVPKQYEKLEDLALKGNYINTVSIVFKNIIDEYPINLLEAPFGDYVICIILAEKGKLKYINEKMAVYRDGVGVWGRIDDKQKIYQTASGFVYLYSYFKKKNKTEVATIFKNRIIDCLSRINVIDNSTKLSEFLESNRFTKEILDFKEKEFNQLSSKNIDNLKFVEIIKYLFKKALKR